MKKLPKKISILSNLSLTFIFVFCFSLNGLAQIKGQNPLQPKPSKTNAYSIQLDSIINSYDQEKLATLYKEYSEKYTRLKNEAEAYALLNNIPLKKYNENGSFDALQKLSKNGTPIYFSLNNANASISTRANYLNTGGGLGLDINGDNLTAHVWDGGPTRPTHQEFDGTGGTNRVTINDGATTLDENSFHAQHVTGTIVASGFQSAAKGMAWQANALTHEWNNDLGEATTEAASGMLVSNHSYGYRASDIPNRWFGQYGSDANDWDNLMYNTPFYLMIVSAGNDGADNTSNGDPLDGQSAYDKLSGHSTAKNNLVVANGQDASINVDGSLNSVIRNSGSSEGPTDDYRIKPDIMGNGTGLYSTYEGSDSDYASISGTSMASPNVTGTLLLLQEHYYNLNSNFMKAATLKGLALHTADDVSSNGPDAQTGWGLMNAKFAAETITTAANSGGSAIIDELTLAQGQTYQITVESDGVNPLLASISWTDPAGAVNSGTNSNTPALVNDLDIRLDNGTSFTPWRLTGVSSNGTGDNIVDPYERIDISGASGSYTLTVSHKGTLSASQNFSLIVTGVAKTPSISFVNITSTTTENTNCSFSDIIVPLNIAKAASTNADINFTINGNSTATSGLDFDLLTTSVTFPMGSISSQNMILRIYHDGFIETDETVVIDFIVNPNGGDAVANIFADTYTLTITDDDTVPLETQNVSLYNEDFEDAVYDVTTSGNAGSDFWSEGNAAATSSYWNTTGNNSVFAFTNDDACNCDKGNDLLTTTVFSMDGPYTSATLTFNHAFADIVPEVGDVLISTGGAFVSVQTLLNTSTDNSGSSYTTPWVNGISVNMTPYIGQATVQVQFRYNDGGSWSYGMAVDDISVTAVSSVNIQTVVNSGTTNDSQDLPGAGTIYTSDTSTRNLMLYITNNNADDYDCVDISVSREGNGAQSYSGSSSPNLVMDKTFKIIPTNTVSSGNVTIMFYFTEAEIAGWEAATGLTRDALMAARENSGTLVETSALTIGTFGSDVTLTGNFTSLSDSFYFGTDTAFLGSSQDEFITTWDTSLGTPGTTITIPTYTGETYNYDVDWDNDGTFDEFGIVGDVTHDYGSAGIYTVAIRGTFPRIYFNNGGDREKILTIEHWGINLWTSMAQAFYGCENLNITNLAIDNPNLSNVTDMSNMFENNNVFNGDITGWDVSNVTTLEYTFDDCWVFDQDLDGWEVSNVTNMAGLFYDAKAFNQNLNSWDVSKVTSMAEMFYGAEAFDGNINSWNVGNVEDMYFMFSSSLSFNQNISGWNTSKVTDMTAMFSDITIFNQDLGAWDVGKVEVMSSMFSNTTGFDQDLGAWDISSATSMKRMFFGITLSTANYDALLIGWNTDTSGVVADGIDDIPSNITFHGGNSKFCLGKVARDDFSTNYTWNITDTGLDTTAPIWTKAPSDMTVECDVTADPDGAFATWLTSFSGISNCGTATVTNDSTGLSDLCGATGTETVTFTLTDGNGKSITADATFTLEDTTNPIWTTEPSDSTIECDATSDPGGAFATWLASFSGTDSCGNATVTHNSTGLSDDCGATGSEIVTFTLTDECGNKITQDATFTIEDTTNPTWTKEPSDSTIECDATSDPGGAFATWLASFSGTDSCGNATVTHNSTGLNDDCGATVSETVTFTLTDECGNKTIQDATFTVEDTTDPIWTAEPSDSTVECDGTPEPEGTFADWLESFSGTDSCGNATVTHNSTGLSDDCGATGSETVTFTLTDECGNKVTQDATFTIVDSVKPDLSCPLDQYVDTGGTSYYTMPDYFATGEATASDSCSDITITQDPLPGSVQRVTASNTPIVVTLSATDGCGNISICDFELSINLFADDDDSFALYPNPTSSSSTIEFVARESGDITISISDFSGRIVQREVITVIGGEVVKEIIDISRLSSATYIIHLTGSNFNKTLKLIKN